jgi:hypothetical protein
MASRSKMAERFLGMSSASPPLGVGLAFSLLPSGVSALACGG